MGSVTNLSATRRTVRALRAAEQVGENDAALIRLAETTAAALDDATKEDAPAYAVAKLATAHREALRTLLDYARYEPPDAFDAFLVELTTPTPGVTDDPSRLG